MGGGFGGIIAAGIAGASDLGKTVAAGVAAQKAFKRTKEVLKNKHQWEVEDLIAAGLNPILSATKGAGSVSFSPIGSIPSGGASGATALGAAKFKSELEVLRAHAESLSSSALNQREQAGLNIARRRKVELEVREFPPTVGGVARRVFGEGGLERFGETIGKAPEWIKDRLRAIAERLR